MSHWFMYLFTRLDGFNNLCVIFATLVLVAYGISAFGFLLTLDEKETSYQTYRKYCVSFWKVGWLALLLNVLVPTQKEVAAIYLVPKMVNNERLQGLAGTSMSILEQEAKSYLNSLLPKKEKVEEVSE